MSGSPGVDAIDRLDRRIRFLDAKIQKLRTEKADLERQAGAMVDLDEAQVLRDKAAAMATEIESLQAERDSCRRSVGLLKRIENMCLVVRLNADARVGDVEPQAGFVVLF